MERLFALLLSISLLGVFSGCVYAPPVWDLGDPIYHTDEIKIGETTKEEVIEIFGKPDSQTPMYFEYIGSASLGFVAVPEVPGSSRAGQYGLIGDKSWWVRVAFKDDGTVALVRTSKDPEIPNALALDLDKETVIARFETCRGFGDKCFNWACIAAHYRHASAQHRMGKHYEYGNEPVRQDQLRAYVWYRLAEMNGFEGKWPYFRTDSGFETILYSERVAVHMTRAQIAEAERQVAEWEPNPAECEEIAAQAYN